MDWTPRSAGNASGGQIPRLVFVILAVAGAVVLALAGAGCGHATGASNRIAVGGSGCPTQGVGGDTLPPPCAATAGGYTGGTNGKPSPAAQSAPPGLGVAGAAAPAGAADSNPVPSDLG